MGIALLTIADLFMPLQSLAGRWMPSRSRGAEDAGGNGGLRYVSVRPARMGRPASQDSDTARPSPGTRPLRVVRTADRQAAAKVVISGRMADVCAELDRLAALEAQAPAGTPPTRALH